MITAGARETAAETVCKVRIDLAGVECDRHLPTNSTMIERVYASSSDLLLRGKGFFLHCAAV